MDRIDFRSDTVTWPTPEMREAMARAEVGDDVYGEDPTVNALEARAAERMGKQAGLFVASGTMGNLTATLTHAGRGDEAIMGREAHTFQWEAGGMASLGGVTPNTLPTDAEGRLDPEQVRQAIRWDDPHLPRSRLLLLENTFGGRQGAPLPRDYFREMREIADRYELKVHLDGARIFNAAVALDLDPRELARDVDSVTFCLSKGLCAPAGSVLCGSREFVRAARRVRKSLGGGMRQAGILAAAGLVALESMTERLRDDHRHARILADGLAEIPGIRIEPERVRTNIVMFELREELGLDPPELTRRLREEHRVWLGGHPPRTLRAVTHYWVGKPEVEALLKAVREVVAGGGEA
jgi:threonine aldolase